MPTDFFSLPLELRACVYELVLCDATYQPTASWLHAAKYYNPLTLTSLLTVGRCMSHDIQLILKEKLLNDGFFAFDDPLCLYDFRHWLAGQQELTNISFCIRFASREDYAYNQEDDYLGDFMLAQHGAWMMRGHNYSPRCHRIREWVFENYLSECSRRDGGFSWIHDRSMPRCTVVEVPNHENSLQLTLYEPRYDEYSSVPYMELKGLFKDLSFERFDADYWRAWRYQTRGTPWKHYGSISRPESYSREYSPDLDEDERYEMDTDSWGGAPVPNSEDSDFESSTDHSDTDDSEHN